MRVNFSDIHIDNSFEIVERKGIGHPDTLADLITEEFSNNYSRYCIKKFGAILNHWADKVVLSGGVSKLDFGSYKIKKPITIYLFGKAVTSVGDVKIPIEKIFVNSYKKVLKEVFKNKAILTHINYVVDINSGIGREHTQQFYQPKSKKDILTVETYKSNDTVICSGFAPYSISEKMAIDIENYVNSEKFKKKYPYTGYDVKVVITKIEDFYDITLCVPFIADKTPSFKFYLNNKNNILKDLNKFVSNIKYLNKKSKFLININTKDFGDHGYLVAFGTALDKGDFGAVGRGNKYSGVISLNRKTNMEAVAGKNPQNHSGKLFTIFSHHIAWKLYKIFRKNVSVDITAKNGEDINNPSYIFVNMESEKSLKKSDRERIKNLIFHDIKKINHFYKQIINRDTIKEHIKRNFIYD